MSYDSMGVMNSRAIRFILSTATLLVAVACVPDSMSTTTSTPLSDASTPHTASTIDLDVTPPGATVTGRVVLGYGSHRPVGDLPLRVGKESRGQWDTYTDGDGYFVLTGVPTGLVDIVNNHLSFQIPTSTTGQLVDLGILKYPLVHPPNYYYWQAAPLPELSYLLEQGEPIGFDKCLTEPNWQRPTKETQQEKIWSKRPFSELPERLLQRFEQPAVIYDTVDLSVQSFPGELNLDDLGADWLYLTGLWTSPNPIVRSSCSHDAQSLEDLLHRRQIEVWLRGYNAIRVQLLGKDEIEYEDELCDPSERGCIERPGHHFAVHVVPAKGYQIIRFEGVEDVLAIHLIKDGQEFFTLP